MNILVEWMNRLRYAGRRTRFDGELDDEIRLHMETRSAELERAGASHGDALAQARREFGPVARVQEESRSAWQFAWLEDLAADLHFAFRSFRRSPGFTLTAVASLALGIGANSAIFTALDAVLWRQLPVADPDRLVNLSVLRRDNGTTVDPPAGFVRRVRESRPFPDVITASSDGLSFSYDDRAERIVGEVVSWNFFAVLGVQPILGQAFSPAVRQGSWAAEAVLSYNFWKRRFGGDPAVIGSTIRLNTYPFTLPVFRRRRFSASPRAPITRCEFPSCRRAGKSGRSI